MVAHGGIVASIIDRAKVHACTSIDCACMTAELNIKYKKTLPLNTRIKITATAGDLQRILAYTVVYTEAIIEVADAIVGRARTTMMLQKNYIEHIYR